MKRRLPVLILILCLAVFAAACGTSGSNPSNGAAPASSTDSGSAATTPAVSDELTLKHQLGETKVKKNPKKVIAFDYGALDTLDKLGIEVTGVAQKNLPPYLAKYKDSKYQNIGTLQEPDYEKISSIKPDLILISGRQQTAYPELSKLAPTIYVGVDNKNFMESFKTNMKMIGQIFSKESEVDAEVAKIEKQINDVKTKAASVNKNALIILANEGAISAYGPGSRFGLIHDVLGVPAVEKNLEVSTHGQSISFEFIAEKNPDYLFVVDRGAAVGGTAQTGAKSLVENELVKKTKAFTNNNIVYLDQNYWYLSGGGLESVAEMVGEIAKDYK
ncbi:siderophore ABC transporter substrate-binding protein [Paenibacillus doosanensis]|uniref:ABC transporter solute-binding protein YclQ n=1 Tax=Paenibacillus konkukensis TaxID=2020716 RepID=A0ABY4RRR5_9BACL|nr:MULTISPECIES: siderophore ABC transporter substrate-binding protein [Paenibacillus]MCS7459630.1 siderophore ABC transporter substrate-binding protein [Paenibacillus doosanensis]UQZ84710.1 putative ABC transporter solute-binding protein YclQ precursor [Paenibacillus konkukensis]